MTLLCARLIMIGPVKFHNITGYHAFGTLAFTYTVIRIVKSTITIHGHIEFSQITAETLILYSFCETQECFTMNVADNATLMIVNNSIGTHFYAEWDLRYYHATKMNYPPCFFQYLNSSTTNDKMSTRVI